MLDLDRSPLSPEQRSALSLALHNALRCNCDSGAGHDVVVDEIAPLIASWIATETASITSLATTYHHEFDELTARMDALTAKLADVPRWLDLNGMDPQSVAFVQTALDAALTSPEGV